MRLSSAHVEWAQGNAVSGAAGAPGQPMANCTSPLPCPKASASVAKEGRSERRNSGIALYCVRRAARFSFPFSLWDDAGSTADRGSGRVDGISCSALRLVRVVCLMRHGHAICSQKD